MAWALPTSTTTDRDSLLGPGVGRVHLVEYGWLTRMRTVELYAYRFAADSFAPFGEPVSAIVATHAVRPLAPPEPVGDLLELHAQAGIELRVTTNLWPYCDAVVASTLGFSAIRMRNAQHGRPRRRAAQGRAARRGIRSGPCGSGVSHRHSETPSTASSRQSGELFQWITATESLSSTGNVLRTGRPDRRGSGPHRATVQSGRTLDARPRHCQSSPASRLSRARVSSLPRICIDSNSGGEILAPEMATLIGVKPTLGLSSNPSSTD